MAPWPEQGNEPKAPDKNSDKCENITLDEEVKSRIESAENPDSSIQPSKPDQNLWASCDTGAESGQFRDLDEGQLKALLEEAITYKSPKDRESKSVLFKELLLEAEADESDCSDETAAAAVASTGPSGGGRSHLTGSRLSGTKRRHGKRDIGVAEGQRSGGSLQNLVHAFRGTASGRHSRDHVTSSVSARQREGGSLPTNVNVQGVESEDVTHSTELVYNYTSRATLQVSEDPHHVDMSVSFPLSSKQGTAALNGIEQPPLQLHSSYNSVKCVMGSNSDTKMAVSGAAESTTMLYPVQHVSFLSIPPQPIPPGLETNVYKDGKRAKQERTTATRSTKKSASDLPEVSVSNDIEWTSAFAPTKYFYPYPIDTWSRNSELLLVNVRDMSRIALTKDASGEKMKNYRNIVPAEKIEGHRGEDNIESLIQYIESPSSGNNIEQNKAGKTRQTNGPVNLVSKGTRGVNKIRAKEDEGRKRRGKETKLHKCNSLEEISKTKLEDLTSPSNSQEETGRARPKKQVTLDDAQLSALSLDEQHSASEDTVPLCSMKKKEDVLSDDAGSDGRKKKSEKKPDSLSDSVPGNEFHLVQKKQRRKKRQVTVTGRVNSGKVGGSGYYGGRGFSTHDRVERDGRSLYRYRHGAGPPENVHPRRKSASSVPPSDNSDCSDEGSVCSLPVSSTTPRPNVGKTSTSGGSTPQASYADIARSVASPPRAACPVNLPRRSTPASTVPSSAASSGIGDEETSASPEPVFCTKKDAMTDTNLDTFLPIEEYPPLKGPSSELIVEYTVKRGRSNRESSITVDEALVLKPNSLHCNQKVNRTSDSVNVLVGGSVKTPAPAPVPATTPVPTATKRPPVILLDEGRASPRSSVTELTFGFEVNQQLLCDDESAENSPSSAHLESPPCSPTSSLDKIVNYVGLAWEDVMRELPGPSSGAASSSGAKVQYYSGQ
ncbi:uncharacterized protein LOC142323647 isoform X2 [Lycorma delicatula]|uniref:uncharacterized protein LOC142323647 isoform X2 n=1 Tax=Lycorma delicatula TaxID=130591 RepID=UPI003F5183C5